MSKSQPTRKYGRHFSVAQMPRDRAKVTLVDRRNPLSHSASLTWTDSSLHIDDFDLTPLGKVEAVQDDLLASPPRGWVVLDGECHRRPSTYLKLLPRRLRPKRP